MEDEEATLPEDGILLTYIVKQSRKKDEMEATDNLVQPAKDVPAYVADIPMSRDNEGISENSQKSQETIDRVENIAVTPLMSQQMIESDEIPVEEPIESQSVRMDMRDKLVKAVSNLGNKVTNGENLKIPAIDLMLQIQAALDECKVFPENTTVDILDITNRIPDKSALAWKEKLNGGSEIDSYEVRAFSTVSIKGKPHKRARKMEGLLGPPVVRVSGMAETECASGKPSV